MKLPYKLNADIVMDTAEKTNEEIFGMDSIRNDKNVLTGSQLGVALGLSPYQTPLMLWKEKCHITESEVDQTVEVLLAGHAAEDFVAKMFARKMVEDYPDILESVEIINDTNMYRSRKYPWAVGQPDRFAILTMKNGERKLVGLECKTTYNGKSIEKWKDGSFECPTSYDAWGNLPIPATYDAQCRQYMMVTGLDSWYICCCWGFMISNCAISLVKRDAEKEAYLDEMAKSFIHCCEEGIEPMVSEENAAAVAEMLNRKYDLANEDVFVADASYSPIIEKALSLSQRKAEIKKLQSQLEKDEAMFTADLIEMTGGKTCLKYANEAGTQTFIKLGVSKKSDTLDLKKLEKEAPDIFKQMSQIGLPKVSKTDLSKIVLADGKKFDPTPYVIPGGINADSPIKLSKVKVTEIVA